jgi:stalled ribosome rescue protein Dom34
MTHSHAVVWIDHAEAKVPSFDAKDVQETAVHPATPHLHVHHKAGGSGTGKSAPDSKFLREVADSMRTFREILIVGPGLAKTEFADFIRGHDPSLGTKIVGVETVDHPTSGQIVAYARKYFRAADRMRH